MGFSGKSWGRPNFEKSGADPPRFHSMTDWEMGSVDNGTFRQIDLIMATVCIETTLTK